jgi:hypothetical protein
MMPAMITINLLPPEYRKQERTPLSRFIVLLVGVLILFSSGAFFVYVRYYLLDFANTELATTKAELENVKERHDYYKALVVLQKKYQTREDTIRNIKESRIPWSVKLMQFYDFFALDEFSNRAWIDGLTVRMTQRRVASRRATGPQAAGQMQFTIHTIADSSDTWNHLTDFREALKGDSTRPDIKAMGVLFWEKDFMSMTDPRVDRHFDENMEPSLWFSDDLTLDIKGRGQKPQAPRATRRAQPGAAAQNPNQPR